MKNNIFSYILTLILLFIIWILIKDNYIFYMQNLNFSNFLISILIVFPIHSLSGFQYFNIRKVYNIPLNRLDIVLLPIVMKLYNFVFPFQGGLIFTSFYFKKKFGLKILDNFNIYAYLYSMTLIISGLCGLIFFIISDLKFFFLGLISLFFIVHPIFILWIKKLLLRLPESKISFFFRIQTIINSIALGLENLWKDKFLTKNIFVLNIARLFLYVIWYIWISYSLKLNIDLFYIIIIAIIGNILLIVKFTPENIGVHQLISGIFLEYLGTNGEIAIIITLYATITNIFLIFTVGIVANFYYTSSLNIFALYKKHVND